MNLFLISSLEVCVCTLQKTGERAQTPYLVRLFIIKLILYYQLQWFQKPFTWVSKDMWDNLRQPNEASGLGAECLMFPRVTKSHLALCSPLSSMAYQWLWRSLEQPQARLRVTFLGPTHLKHINLNRHRCCADASKLLNETCNGPKACWLRGK